MGSRAFAAEVGPVEIEMVPTERGRSLDEYGEQAVDSDGPQPIGIVGRGSMQF